MYGTAPASLWNGNPVILERAFGRPRSLERRAERSGGRVGNPYRKGRHAREHGG